MNVYRTKLGEVNVEVSLSPSAGFLSSNWKQSTATPGNIATPGRSGISHTTTESIVSTANHTAASTSIIDNPVHTKNDQNIELIESIADEIAKASQVVRE